MARTGGVSSAVLPGKRMRGTGVFWNAKERRWRAGWRLLLQLFFFGVILAGAAALGNVVASGVTIKVIASLLYLAGVPASVWLLSRFVDHRPFAGYGFHFSRRWTIDFVFGLLLGGLMLTGVFLTERMAGWVTVTGGAVTTTSLPMGLAVLVPLLSWIGAGVNEELTFRGYQLTNLAEGLAGSRLAPLSALRLAAVISSVSFGLAHVANRNATIPSTANIMLSGLLLSLPVLLTGELGLSIGLHITWNLFEGTVFGFAVSGEPPGTHLLTIRQDGPTVWTGGAFGPEAGLVCTIWMLAGCGAIAAFAAGFRKRLA